MTGDKPTISEQEAEELIKGMGGCDCMVVVDDDGFVRAVAISARPDDARIQMELDARLDDVLRKHRIVKKSYR